MEAVRSQSSQSKISLQQLLPLLENIMFQPPESTSISKPLDSLLSIFTSNLLSSLPTFRPLLSHHLSAHSSLKL